MKKYFNAELKKKIAIVTEYYNSSNYGGALQAYALTRYLNENNVFAEQLPYQRPQDSFWSTLKREKGLLEKIAFFFKKVIQKTLKRKDFGRVQKRRAFFGEKIGFFFKKVIQKTLKRKDFGRVQKRRELVMNFGRKQIPHNKLIFSDETFKTAEKDQNCDVAKMLQQYSIFITGSDQVWRSIKKDPYFLTFVPKGKTKISYAASIARLTLSNDEQRYFKNALKDFDAISVREKTDINLLNGLCKQKVEWVVDPILLLTDTQWRNICAPRLCNEKYVFCYFLGGEKKPRKIAREYARKHNLKLLTMPYLTPEYPFEDFCKIGKNEERLFEVGIEDFLSLIRYAEVVFSDSFHAVVLSGIFERQYYVFERTRLETMNSRIKSILEIYETPERFCDIKEKETMKYIESLQPIDYDRQLIKLENMKEKSISWLNEYVR